MTVIDPLRFRNASALRIVSLPVSFCHIKKDTASSSVRNELSNSSVTAILAELFKGCMCGSKKTLEGPPFRKAQIKKGVVRETCSMRGGGGIVASSFRVLILLSTAF
jgi:hypothetical protein